jgi:hypothetical protein
LVPHLQSVVNKRKKDEFIIRLECLYSVTGVALKAGKKLL